MERQWKQLEQAAEIISMAPDDEVSAEMLAVQYELLQQLAINRSCAARLLQTVVQDTPRQLLLAEERVKGTETARTWSSVSKSVARH